MVTSASTHKMTQSTSVVAAPEYPISVPFPGVIAHHPGPSHGQSHAGAFHDATVDRGLPASDYFRSAGISSLAEENGGLCTFWMGQQLAVYQITNTPLIGDNSLAPSTDANRDLFGDFMGSLPHDHQDRPTKRAAIERSLGNAKFIEGLEPAIRRYTGDYLRRSVGQSIALDDFTLTLTAYVDSMIPGVLDLTEKPLPEYLQSAEYGPVVRGFFDLASDVISNNNPQAMRDFDIIVPFVRDLLTDNLGSLAKASSSNMIRRYFALWEHPLTRDGLDSLDTARIKELGTIIVATYDTTALSLMWALSYIESEPDVKKTVIAEASSRSVESCPAHEAPSVIDLAVLEAVRLGGSNPCALWRRTTAPFTLHHRGTTVTIPSDTMLWLDRRQANRDPAVFPEPDRFAPANIQAIFRTERETVASLISRGRYEINSFSMINADRNPRKCPGRLFSVQMQSVVLSELYGAYAVSTDGVDLHLKRHASMPRPAAPGTITIYPRTETAKEPTS